MNSTCTSRSRLHMRGSSDNIKESISATGKERTRKHNRPNHTRFCEH
jgi:hypothetical protein